MDVDAATETGMAMKKEGFSSEQVWDHFVEEGLKEQKIRFVMSRISKHELEEYAQKSTVGGVMGTIIGLTLTSTGLILLYFLFFEIKGYWVISTIPFILIAMGTKQLMGGKE